MVKEPKKISIKAVRRLALANQGLAGEYPKHAGSAEILKLMKRVRYLQLDPISVVAPSHQTVLWSRLGPFELAELDRLMWKERRLFEYWGHAASIVLTEDYALHKVMMKTYGKANSPWHGKVVNLRVRDWMRTNAALRGRVMRELKNRGPLLSRDFEEPRAERSSGGWDSGRKVGRMLDSLQARGAIMVSGRQGIQKMWDLTERCLPTWAPRAELSLEEMQYEGAQCSLKALGVADAKQIGFHFIGKYPDLKRTLRRLSREGRVIPVEVAGGAPGKGERFVHADDLERLEGLESGGWSGRTTLLSPFDNLIIDRGRTAELFDFEYKIEIYTPEKKRKYGYYVLPILDGERIIGRVDPALDRERGKLVVKSVHAEKAAPRGADAGRRVAEAVESLARFLRADEVEYSGRVPEFWKSSLR